MCLSTSFWHLSHKIAKLIVDSSYLRLATAFFCFFFETVSLCHPCWSTVAWSWLIATSTSWVPSDSPVSAFWVAGIIGVRHHTQLIFVFFVFLVEMGFHHVGQAILQLLTSGVPPTSASQSAEMTRVSHCTWLSFKALFYISLWVKPSSITEPEKLSSSQNS